MDTISCDPLGSHSSYDADDFREALDQIQLNRIRRKLPHIPRFARNDITLQVYLNVNRADDT